MLIDKAITRGFMVVEMMVHLALLALLCLRDLG